MANHFGQPNLSHLPRLWRNRHLPYITYKEDGKQKIIFYENTQSLAYKMDLVRQADLGGIAIWALGYEGDAPELWEVIERKVE